MGVDLPCCWWWDGERTLTYFQADKVGGGEEEGEGVAMGRREKGVLVSVSCVYIMNYGL